jgi:hypothetical protein
MSTLYIVAKKSIRVGRLKITYAYPVNGLGGGEVVDVGSNIYNMLCSVVPYTNQRSTLPSSLKALWYGTPRSAPLVCNTDRLTLETGP